MSNNLSRKFTRLSKHFSGEPLKIDDISVVVSRGDPDSVARYKASRQYNSDYWHVYENNITNFGMSYEVLSGVSLKEALDKLEEIENKHSAKLRGKKGGLPYNHFSKVREMLAAEEAALAPAAQAPAAVETQSAVAVKGPLALKRNP